MDKIQARLKKYWHYAFCLVVAILSYFLLYLLLNKVYPGQIQNFLWPNSYLPFFITLFVGNFFLITFIFLDKKIGLTLAFMINLTFYFRINHIIFNLLAWLIILLISTTLFLLVYLPTIEMARKKQK